MYIPTSPLHHAIRQKYLRTPMLHPMMRPSYFNPSERAKLQRYMRCITYLKLEDIEILENNQVKIHDNISKLNLFEDNITTYGILRKMYPEHVIVNIDIKYTNDMLLDFTDYDSVRNTYNILTQQGHKITSNKELLKKAIKSPFPKIKLIKTTTKLGDTAFPGSKTKQYRLDKIQCRDLSLIMSATI